MVFFIIAILTGVPSSDIHHKVIGFIRNRILQSYVWMLPFVFVSYLGWKTQKHPPPYYEKIVNNILGGENDNFKIAKRDIAKLESINPRVATQFSNVISVFEERLMHNTSEIEASAARANVFIRQLDSNIEDEWSNHPLRLHALAEAKVLAIQAALSDPDINISWDDQDCLFNEAISLYEKVSQSTSPLAIYLLRTSARQNLGNTYLYRKDFRNAEKIYRSIVNNSETRNSSTWGNLIASLVSLGDFNEAIEQGCKAKDWAEKNGKASTEPSAYASILENTALAYWGKGEFNQAHELITYARAFRDDNLNTANLALSYRFLGKLKRPKEPCVVWQNRPMLVQRSL